MYNEKLDLVQLAGNCTKGTKANDYGTYNYHV